MKIKEVTTEQILFDNGYKITYGHEPDCCESNYADFDQLDDIARDTVFDEDLTFEEVPESGFRFGNNNGKMFFVPCYSDQNGYYSSDVEIFLNGKSVLGVGCELRDYW